MLYIERLLSMNLENLCHTNNSYLALSSDKRAILDDILEASHDMDVVFPDQMKHILWKVMLKNGILIDNNIFELLEPNDSLEVWTDDSRFLFVVGPLLSQMSYSIDELSSKPWHELFERDKFSEKKILETYVQVLNTGKMVTDVCDWHLVSEIHSNKKVSLLIIVSAIAPFKSNKGFSGVVAIVKTKLPA